MIGYNFPPDPPDYNELYYEPIVCNKCGKENDNMQRLTAQVLKDKTIKYYVWFICNECLKKEFDEFKIKPEIVRIYEDDGKCEYPF